jgi:hypothetical protein
VSQTPRRGRAHNTGGSTAGESEGRPENIPSRQHRAAHHAGARESGSSPSAMCPCARVPGLRRTDRARVHGRDWRERYTDHPPISWPLTSPFKMPARCRHPLLAGLDVRVARRSMMHLSVALAWLSMQWAWILRRAATLCLARRAPRGSDVGAGRLVHFGSIDLDQPKEPVTQCDSRRQRVPRRAGYPVPCQNPFIAADVPLRDAGAAQPGRCGGLCAMRA